MRPCDCVMNVGMCSCGETMQEARKGQKDIMLQKINRSYTITRSVVLELERVMNELGLDNESALVESLITDFINDFIKKSKTNKEPKMDFKINKYDE